MSARGIIFLTDGFERLPLVGMHVKFHLADDWTVIGDPCSWIWPHEAPGTVVGGEVETDRGRITFDGEPTVLHKGERIVVTPRLTLGALVAA